MLCESMLFSNFVSSLLLTIIISSLECSISAKPTEEQRNVRTNLSHGIQSSVARKKTVLRDGNYNGVKKQFEPHDLTNEKNDSTDTATDIMSYEIPFNQNTTTKEDKQDDKLEKAGEYRRKLRGKKGHKLTSFGEKVGHKKGHATKGFQNTFHRDEYHKEHKLYDDPNNGRHGSKLLT